MASSFWNEGVVVAGVTSLSAIAIEVAIVELHALSQHELIAEGVRDSPGRHDDDESSPSQLGGARRFASVRHENADRQGGPIGTPDRGAVKPVPPPSRP
jgi:hypothetical protein